MLDKHQAIVGITGSGKTVYATNLFLQQPFSVLVNTNAEVYPEQKCQVIIHDLEGLKTAWNEYSANKIVFSPTLEHDITQQDVEKLCQALLEIGKAINRNRVEPKIWCHLLIDEIQEYSNKTQKSRIIDRIWKRGRRYGVVGVAISQRPAEISHTILNNCSSHVIFNVSNYETEYFRSYNIPVLENPEIAAWIQKPYHYVIWNGVAFQKCTPVPKT